MRIRKPLGWQTSKSAAEADLEGERTHSPAALTPVRDPRVASWIRDSIAARSWTVGAVLPTCFDAYVRVHHPFEDVRGFDVSYPDWQELAAAASVELRTRAQAAAFAAHALENANAQIGTLPRATVPWFVEHLRPATQAPDHCVFAVWEGFGALAMPTMPTAALDLPDRRDHLYAGAVEVVQTDRSLRQARWQSAMATQVDFAWTYVGASKACVAAFRADARLDTGEVIVTAEWQPVLHDSAQSTDGVTPR